MTDKNIVNNANRTFTFIIRLSPDERKRLKKLSRKLELNDFETIKYCIQLVSWWAKNEIEPEEA